MTNSPAAVHTVPLFVADVVVAGRPDIWQSLEGAAVLVGDRVELDLEAVASGVGVAWANAFAEYWMLCRRFWKRMSFGAPLDVDAIATRRVLVDAVQATGRVKQDLGAELAAVKSMPVVSEIAKVLLAGECDLGALRATVSDLGGSVEQPEEGMTVVTVPVPLAGCPVELGGVATAGESGRWLTLVARHATWRDNERRRLARVVVQADAAMPSPEECVAVRDALAGTLAA